MKINHIELYNVRNHTNINLLFDNESIIIGENGSGKTTIIEAIHIIFSLKPFKKQTLSKVITFKKDVMKIKAEAENDNRKVDIVFKYDGKRRLYFDDIETDNISEYLYSYPIACYNQDNPNILSKEQSDRRSFIDRYSFYENKEHINDIKNYNRLILQKGAELNKENPDKTYIEVINDKITDLSFNISERRKNLIKNLNNELKEIYKDSFLYKNNFFISYSTNINNKSILKNEFKTKRCEYGIHRDRIDIYQNEKIIEKFSSFGQKKTFSLLTLYAAMKYIEKIRKISIISLLDDFEAGLDKTRASFLKEIFSYQRQAIYTGVENIRLGFKNTINL